MIEVPDLTSKGVLGPVGKRWDSQATALCLNTFLINALHGAGKLTTLLSIMPGFQSLQFAGVTC